MKFRNFFLSILVLLSLVCCHTQVWALAIADADYNIDFRFSNPGARANAMGGAFIGLADDATAAYANPAGLTILTQPEASIEFKNSETKTDLYSYDRVSDEFAQTEVEASISTASFLGYVKPLENMTFCLYRHELINIEQDSKTGPFYLTSMAYDLSSDFHLNTVTYGAGVGIKIIDSLSIGFTVGFAQTDYQYKSDRISLSDSATAVYSYVHDTDSATLYNVSFLFNPIENLNIGAVYRYGPEFDTIYFAPLDGSAIKNTLDIPDVFGFGISYRFFNALTVAVDVNRIEYSDLLKDYYYYDSSKLAGHRWVPNTTEFDADDTTEIHAGLEYVFTMNNLPVALRCGYADIPAHFIYYTDDELAVYEKTKLEGEDDKIVSFGFGTVVSDNFQIDLSVSSGDFIKEYIVSCVYRVK